MCLSSSYGVFWLCFVDTWMSGVDDKENTIPDGVVPKLSDPSEFDTDYDKPFDEVDGYIDENLNLPEINNEVCGEIW